MTASPPVVPPPISPRQSSSARSAGSRPTCGASLVRVINATGVIIHTNLGRAPLARPRPSSGWPRSPAATRTSSTTSTPGIAAAATFTPSALLCRLTGAEAAVVVNNNAAATLLMLAALAAGREVIVSRGELVEIGGGFRVPDVMAQSGAMLREVGTTNRTRAADYAAAISDRTALILRVHPSNFRIEGFTERPALDRSRRHRPALRRAGGRGPRAAACSALPRCTALADETDAVATSLARRRRPS